MISIKGIVVLVIWGICLLVMGMAFYLYVELLKEFS